MKKNICVLLAVLGLASSVVMAEPDCYKFKNAQARENCFKHQSDNKYDKHGDRDSRDKKSYYRDNDFKRYDKRDLDCNRFESLDVRRDCRRYKYGENDGNYSYRRETAEQRCGKSSATRSAFEACMAR
ncbi:hypothetical protein HQ393_10200 [Chitinibacter bivalviorum]|uniref:Uncharacterized protein n=1 Tax=Chitinibacter bivalviorum TaxID=2739434 RepID=A0A7H9BJN7_9NEIS|nr:hypothetical protein [Chitinibacter bivalviorum]QLG88582.1 hypothetical protein HQ393_10200 [Chitinibacter bivalviorum]